MTSHPAQIVKKAQELLRAGEPHQQAQDILIGAIAALPEDAADVRSELILKAWLAASIGMEDESRHAEVRHIFKEVLPRLRDAYIRNRSDGDLGTALAVAEGVAGWIACAYDNDDATAHIHFRRAIETCDSCGGCEPADVLFCLHFFITTSRDPDLNPHAMYEWAQPYLQALEPKDCRHGAVFLDLLGGWFLAEGDLASARRMYAELLKIANEELADEDAKPTVRKLIQEATAQLLKAMGGSP